MKRSESKGLVVYGASGLASHDQAMKSHDITTTAIVHSDKEEPNNIQSQATNLHSDTRNCKLHDSKHVSHDEFPEIKSVSSVIVSGYRKTHQIEDNAVQHISPRRTHDIPPKSHDILPNLQDRQFRSHDRPPKSDSSHRSHNRHHRSHDSVHRSHDHPHRSHDSPHRSHDSPHRSHDNSRRSHDSPCRSHDNPYMYRSHDSPHRSHDGFKHYELGPQFRRSSRESSPVIQNGRARRISADHIPDKASSLTHHAVPEYSVVESEDWTTGSDVGGGRIIDPAAKPKNRTRLSLPDGAYEATRSRGTRWVYIQL